MRVSNRMKLLYQCFISWCSIVFLEDAKAIHRMADYKNMKLKWFVLNRLVDMYAKCGDLECSGYIFFTRAILGGIL